MSGGVVCYIERWPGGTGIRRLRLIAAGLARSWTAPEARSVSSLDAGIDGSGPAVSAARAGATWIAETLAAVGLNRLAAVCVDSEGSICAWLSAPSPEATVVRATIVQSSVDGDGAGMGAGAARLLTMTDGDAALTEQTSLQALATIEPEEDEPAKRSGVGLRKKVVIAAPRKQRYAVVAIQDAVARVLIDELDERGIEVDRVVSLWHAMAGAWDRAEPASMSDRMVSSDAPGGAVILVEPQGRLVWAWTKGGELVAGGTMRLASHARRPAGENAASESTSESLATQSATPETARRSTFDTSEAEEAPVNLEFTTAEAGRIAVDWLAWSAQLGHCPQRVVCLSVPSVTGGGMGPEALFSHLAQAWPGATIDGAVHEDPIGATIGRLAGLGPEIKTGEYAPAAAPVDELPYHLRPRQALAALSSRPGRADRRLYQWIGVSLCAAAGFVGVLGWKVRASINSAQAEIDAARTERDTAMKQAEASVPGISGLPPSKRVDALQAAVTRVSEQVRALKPARPMLEEAVRVLTALRSVNSDPAAPTASRTTMTELEMNIVAGKVVLQVPDVDTGPTILEKVLQTSGVLVWEGSTSTLNGQRTYTLLATWPENNVITPGKAPAAPPPTPPTPAAPPAGAAPGNAPPNAPSDPKAEGAGSKS